MAVEFNNSGVKYIKWTNPVGAIGNTAKTIHVRFYYATAGLSQTLFLLFDGTGTDTDEYFYFSTGSVSNLKVQFGAHFSTTDGVWVTTNNVLTAGAINDIIVTYDGSSTSNNPSIYVNGISAAITRSIAPVGTYRTGTGADIYLGDTLSAGNPNGKILSANMYSAVLSSQEIAEMSASKVAIPNWRRLVFAPALWNVADNATLGATNIIRDLITGVSGVPTGSPTGRADNYLTIEGIN